MAIRINASPDDDLRPLQPSTQHPCVRLPDAGRWRMRRQRRSPYRTDERPLTPNRHPR
jgi:hypothetical protein